MEKTVPAPGCERCQRLEKDLRALQAERDELWLSLAKERQRANAILLSFPHAEKSEPIVAPPIIIYADPGPQPLRYKVADMVNNGMKRLLPFGHGGARQTVQRLLSRNR